MTEFGAAASSSSSSISKWPYHVFLSFRGEDTRYGFTGNLYHALCRRGIRTFIDDEGIRKGEEITPTLLKTIKESKAAIVVLSKNYASSTFCLTELAHILDCMKGQNDRYIWAVFCDVDPSHVRHQEGTYKDAFDKYEADKDESTVKRWRLALSDAANLSGWPFDPRSKLYEYKIIEEIIQDVSKKIGIGLLHVARFPVGLECRVEEVCSLLNKEPHCDGATIVGIVGTGGIGKTTIARATYNEIAISFKDKCFLDNIKERSICEVQESLLSEILGEKDIKLKDYKNGISVITDRLCGKKVFLVLDDISTLEQLRALTVESNWFGSGSKIIVTTRDKSLLPNHGIYEVPELSDREARQLLILNAFKKEEEDLEYKEIINRGVKYGFGLPLALETFGSTLGPLRTVKEMESFLDMQEKFPDKTVQQSLKVSYDSLGELEQYIFLDIACFHRGFPSGYATDIMSATYGSGVDFCINMLIDKSLIKIDENGRFNMHDLIQDMGREIVRQESPSNVGKRSRLWSCEDIRHVLNENTGTGKVQGLVNSFYYEKVEWSGEGFEKMKNLRVLSFSGGKMFSQGPKCLPNSLRVVDWDSYPSSTLPDNFCPINLVILRLRDSHLKTLGKAFKKFYNLRELNLRQSKILEVPDICGAVNLEELNVSFCVNLTRIDDSVGHLAKLRVLNARGCGSLDTFIVGGIKLVSLEILNLSNCSNFHTFPEILVTMEKIEILDLSHTAIKLLPESIEKLVALERIWLHEDRDLRIPKYKDFSVPHLKTLNLNGCEHLHEFRQIPPTIEVFSGNHKLLTSSSIKALLKQKLYYLHKLDLRWSEILEVPDISGAVNLEELNISYCQNLTKIDDSVGYLAKLTVLNAERCKMLDTFIVGGIKLVSLEILNIRCCHKLHTLPEILVTMEKIKTLDLSHTAMKTLPESFEKLVELEALYLDSCKELRQLPNLACQNLKTLNLDGCKELEEIRGIPPNMEVFFARNCTSLTSRSIRLLLAQELHENGNTQFILPGKEIPKWFHKHSTEGSVSFWVRKKFPQIALCAILRNGSLISSSIKIHINGTHKFDVKDVILPAIEIEIGTDHIILFDLRKQGMDFKIGRDLLEEELNHVVVSWDGIGVGLSYQFVECIGVYVYNYDSCMEDILFENPNPQRGPEEVVHRICDLDLESLSVCHDDRGDFRDWIQEDDKLNKEIIDLAPETVSNIGKKKGQLKVDNVNLTLSLDLSEPSSDTTSHPDDKLNKEIMDSSPKAASSIEKKKRKLNMDDEKLTLSLALPEPSSDATSHHDLQQQQQHQHLTSINQQIPENFEIIKRVKGKDIIVYEGNTNEKKGGNTSENHRISSSSESLSWDRVTWEHQLKGQKDQSTIIDKVYDGRASHYSKDLPQQQHLSSIHQQIPKCFENVKKAKGKDLMVFEGNSNEKQCSNTLESQLQELVHIQTREEKLHLANDESLTHVQGQRTEYFQDKDYGARPPSKRTSDQIPIEHLQEQKKKIREEVVVEVREEMRLREEKMRVEFEEKLASLLASFQQGLISTVFSANSMGNATTSSTVNSTSNITPSSPKEPPT